MFPINVFGCSSLIRQNEKIYITILFFSLIHGLKPILAMDTGRLECPVGKIYGCWFKQPLLGRVALIGLWGWVRLHTCSTLSNQCAQVKPARVYRSLSLNLKIARLPTPPPSVFVWRSPVKATEVVKRSEKYYVSVPL